MSNLLEFNPVATLPGNWIPEEEHTLSPQVSNEFRFFKPNYGPFFLKDLEVYHVKASGEKLKLVGGVHYALGHKYLGATRHIKQPVYVTIEILDRNLSGKFLVSYHSLGDEPTNIINQLVIEGAHALLEPKRYNIEDIIGMPEFLPPVDHDVLTDDVFGWEKNVEALWAIVHALAGDQIIPHKHELNETNGLLDILDSKMSADNSHKSGIHQAQRIISHQGTVSLTLPSCNTRTAIKGTVALYWQGKFTTFIFQGLLHAAAEVNTPNQNWVSGVCESSEELPFESIAFTYDAAKRPVIYFGDGVVFDDVTFILCDVTYNLDYTADKRTGYTFSKETVFRGSKQALVRLDLASKNELGAALDMLVSKGTEINNKPIGEGMSLAFSDLLLSDTVLEYDGDGNITSYTHGGMAHEISYHDGLISKITSDRETQTFNYNDHGLLTSITVE